MVEDAINLPDLPPARQIDVAGGRLSYFTTGDAEARPLLLCHGLAANGLQFVDDAHYFAGKGFRVLVPDLRGHGRSTRYGGENGELFAVRQLAKDLIGLLNAEGIHQIDWVGNSLGGIIALSIMGTEAQRIGRCITFGTAYALDLPEPIVSVMEFAHKTLGVETIARLGAPMTTPDTRAKMIIYEMLRTVDFDAVSGVGRHLLRYDMLAAALAFEREILIIQGTRDYAVNQSLKETLKAMRAKTGFAHIEIEEAGHCANLDQPDAVRREILKFLG